MKNLFKLTPFILLVFFAGLACKNNPFTQKEPEIVNQNSVSTETPTVNPTPAEETLNEKATSLPKPVYPKSAKVVKASGTVKVQVEVDKKGNVTKAQAISGHPLLRAAAEQAAREAKFKPAGSEVVGIIAYTFTAE